MESAERVGFVGLGIMGGNMARNLMKAGYRVTVWNRTASRARALAEEGATVAASAAEVAAAVDVVCTCVTGPDDLLEVVEGPSGIAEGAHDGLLHVDCSTVSPEAARRAAEILAGRGARFVDAPVTGGEKGARDATLTIMAGGDPSDFERARPVLEAMGRLVVHVGPVGSGQTLKLIANMIGGVAMLAACEGIAMGLAAGIDLETMMTVFENSTAQSASLGLVAERVRSGRYAPGFSVANRYKDFVLALDEGRRLRVTLPGAAIAAQMYAAAMAQGRADDDQAVLYHVIRGLNGA